MRPLLPCLLAAALVSVASERLAADPIGRVDESFAIEGPSASAPLRDPSVEPGYVDAEGNVVSTLAAEATPLQLIPEPTTLALLVGGLAGLAYAGRSRSQR